MVFVLYFAELKSVSFHLVSGKHGCLFSLAEAASLPEKSRDVFDCNGGFFLLEGTPAFYTRGSSTGLLGRRLTGWQEMSVLLVT